MARRQPRLASLDAPLVLFDVPILAASVAGADAVDTRTLRVLPPFELTEDPEHQQQAGELVKRLATAWRRPTLSEIRLRSVASAFIAAWRRRATLVTNDPLIWAAAEPAGHPHRITVEGVLAVALRASRDRVLAPEDACRLYARVAATVVGSTPGWPTSDADAIVRWAADAALGVVP